MCSMQTICCFVSLSNSSSQVVSCVGMKAEVQSKRSRVVVFDDISTGMPVMPPGKTRGFIFRYDVKEPGAHTIICSSQFTAQEGDRMYVHIMVSLTFMPNVPSNVRDEITGDCCTISTKYLYVCFLSGISQKSCVHNVLDFAGLL